MMGIFPLASPWNELASLVLLAAAGLLVGSFALNPYDTLRLGRMPKRPELAQSALLIGLAALLWYGGAAGTALHSAGLLILAGMVCGFAGDIFMAGSRVPAGMGAFAVGHILYMLAFRQYALALGLAQTPPYVFAVLVLWIIIGVYWVLQVRGQIGQAALENAGLVYALVLSAMAGIAIGLAIQQPAFWPLAIGGLLFIFSDAVIAARIFAGQRFRYMGDVIWGTYIIAQALIVTSLAVALALL